jgi:energy-coupling factor transporter ATP-binding protein EcfA2
MLTRLSVCNFKLFSEADIELGERVVLVGPNNAGKTSALQALALWSLGARRWVEKYGAGNVPEKRPGVTINRRDLIGLPVPAANLLWRDLHVREGYRDGGRPKTRNVLVEIAVEGLDHGESWRADLEFDYANAESFYCRARAATDGTRQQIPAAAAELRLAYLPPMSGLAANETRLDEGAIGVRIGEGRTAEVLRNLCWQAHQRSADGWRQIVERMRKLFGVALDDPEYIKERGEIAMTYRTGRGVQLDLSACGRGQQQTLLLLAHMAANPGAVLLLDEPDAHLEILRQRQIYDVLTDTARETGSQIIAASHSEVILNEAAGRDLVVAFVGRPHRIDDRGSQVAKALKEIGFEQYLQAQETGWVLYLEGSTDLAILRAFAARLDHAAHEMLERPFVHYVANQPGPARHHFYGLREAVPGLIGLALYDRLDLPLQDGDASLVQRMWRRREIENYLCQRETLLAWAQAQGAQQQGELFGTAWRDTMAAAIDAVATALATLGKFAPWGADVKASDDFLQPLFQRFYDDLGLPNVMRKTDYHTLAPYVDAAAIDPEVQALLDEILRVAQRASPGGGAP